MYYSMALISRLKLRCQSLLGEVRIWRDCRIATRFGQLQIGLPREKRPCFDPGFV